MRDTKFSKTLWLAIVTTILSVLTLVQGEAWIQEYPQVVGYIGIAIGLLGIVFRFLTSMPLGAAVKIKKALKKKDG